MCVVGSDYCELHPMDVRMFINFLIGKWIVYVIRACLFQESYIIFVVNEFITLNWEALCIYMSLFSILPFYIFFSIIFSYTWGLFHSQLRTSLKVVMKSPNPKKKKGNFFIILSQVYVQWCVQLGWLCNEKLSLTHKTYIQSTTYHNL